jgi:hypothetical protein
VLRQWAVISGIPERLLVAFFNQVVGKLISWLYNASSKAFGTPYKRSLSANAQRPILSQQNTIPDYLIFPLVICLQLIRNLSQ